MHTLTVGLVIGSNELWEEVQMGLYDLPARAVMERREVGEWATFLGDLERVQPDVLLVDLDQLSDPLDDVIRQIKGTAASPAVVIVHPVAEPETILRAIRADADEFLYPPMKLELQQALKRIGDDRSKRRAGTRPRGKVFGLLSAKGGCGATTTACHLAAELHRQSNLSVLLADFDLDAGVVGFLMKSQSRYTVVDAVANVNRLDLSFWKALVSNGIPGVEVVTAPTVPGSRRDFNWEDFRDILRFIRTNYDWTVVDLGRSLTPLSMAVLEELDRLLLVTTLDIPALHQTKQTVEVLLDMGYGNHRINLILNRMPKRTDLTLTELEKMLGVPIYATLPNDYPGLYDAYAEGRLLPANTKLSRGLSDLAGKLAGTQKVAKKKGFLLFS